MFMVHINFVYSINCTNYIWHMIQWHTFIFSGLSYRNNGLRRLERAHLKINLEILVLFLSDQKLEGKWHPSYTNFSPVIFNRNFQMLFWFCIVKRSSNYAFGDEFSTKREVSTRKFPGTFYTRRRVGFLTHTFPTPLLLWRSGLRLKYSLYQYQ